MKSKIAKVLGVVLAAITVVSVFTFVAPASAAVTPQTWTKQALPGPAGYVMPNGSGTGNFTILESGPIAQDSATGILYTYARTNLASPLNYSILKSTNNGRTWAVTGTVGQPTATVTAIKVYQGNIYYSSGTFLFKSTDGGVTFLQIASTPNPINCIDVTTLAGRNIDVMGTTAGVYYTDESIPFFTAAPVGSTPLTGNIMALAASPNFATDRALAAIDSMGVVNMIDFGGTWNQLIGSSPAVSTSTIASATIQFTSDFNITTNPGFYFGINGGSTPGVYAFKGITGPGATSTTLLLYGSSTSSTANISSLSVIGTYTAATLYAGIVNSSSKATMEAYSTNSGVSWSTPKKLYGSPSPFSTFPGRNVYIILDRNFAAATSPSNMVFALVGGTGLQSNDQSGFSYSTDKGVSFNQISLINDSVSVINDLAASSGLTYISTSSTSTGGAPTPASLAVNQNFVITAGSYQTETTAAVTADYANISASAACTVIIAPSQGSYTIPASGINWTWNPSTGIITFTGAGTAQITATSNNTIFSITANATGLVVPSVSTGSLVTGLDPNWTATLNHAGSPAVYGTSTSNTTVTLSVVPSPTQYTLALSTGTSYNGTTGTITFTTQNGTATFTTASATASYAWGTTLANATYTGTVGSGVGSTILISAPTLNFNGGGAIAWLSSGSNWNSGANVALTYIAAIAATTGTNRDSIWRTDGTTSTVGTGTVVNYERVFLGAQTILPNTITGMTVTWPTNTIVGTATMVRVSSAFATDNTVFYAAPGAIYLNYSNDKGQTWTTQTTAIGSANGIVDQLSSLVVASNMTQYVGSNSAGTSRVIKTSSNGAGTVLSPAWTEAILTKADGISTMTGVVSSLAVATNGDILAAVTSSGVTYICLSKATATNFATSFTGLVDPNTGTLDATLPTSVNGAFVAPAADYATTGNIFVSLNAGGVYRYSVAGATVTPGLGWLKVDGNTYDTNGAVGAAGTGLNNQLVTTLGGPGSSAEGSGMEYVTDSSAAGQGVSRIRGLSTQAEALLSPTGITFTGLWASSSAVGNVQLWTVDNTNLALYTYVDTLNVSPTGVVFTVTSTTATITFPTIANATGYVAFVNPVQQKTFYTAFNANPSPLPAPIVGTPVISADGKTATVAVSGLNPNTTYYASVWATTPVTSFMYSTSTSFTTSLPVPTAPTGLVPAPGSLYVMTVMSFSWNPVPGATSYELWLDTKSDFSTAQKYTGILNNSFTPPAALANNTLYYWQVRAVNSTGVSAWNGVWTFTTVTVTVPPVTVTNAPAITLTSPPQPTIVITMPPAVTVTQNAPVPTPVYTLPEPNITIQQPSASTPTYIWIIVGVGALLTLAVIILIIRTRRVV